jgi:zinc protease
LDASQRLPVDPKIRYGKLDNGMTYYIRHNELPKGRADFYIVHNVGSMQEEDSQRGLAHFLEHMAFNGSTHFPKERSIDDFTESIGMRMGENMNAYTSFDETVYMLRNAPATRSEVVDSCLLALHDWSCFLTLSDSMIEKERGIIREEWRTRTDAQSRLWEQQFPKMLPGSRYANRLPIGAIEVIEGFRPEELRAYYRKWYRPDLQAVIVVGDVDVNRVEAAIQSRFAAIPKPVDPAQREKAYVPDNRTPLVSIATDKESTRLTLSLYYKHDPVPDGMKGTVQDYVSHYMRHVIAHIMQERFADILQKSSPPFVYAYAGDSRYLVARTKDAWTLAAIVKPGAIDEALTALAMENNRVKLYGFTAAEYDRARMNILKQMESAYNERERQQNEEYAEEYVRHFTVGECIPGIEMEYELVQYISPQLPLENLNRHVRELAGGKDNIVISLTGPEDETYPTETELLEMFHRAQEVPVEARSEEASDEPLLPVLPAPGRIAEVRVDSLFDATVYTLSNGVKVILKETEHKKDQILMYASSPGGSTLFGDADVSNLKLFHGAVNLSGLGNFTATQLSKALAGKNVSCSMNLTEDAEYVSGSAVPADIRTLFELVYLTFTAPHGDAEAYASFEERLRGQIENQRLDPMTVFYDSIISTVFRCPLREKRVEVDDLAVADYGRIIKMYGERMADASDFTFVFVGNIVRDSMIPLMEQYIAALPALHRMERGDASRADERRTGRHTNHFRRSMETPKASVFHFYSARMPWSAETALQSAMLNQILDLVYTEKAREQESGTYSVVVSGALFDFPHSGAGLTTYFDTDPTLCAKLSALVKEELQEIVRNGPREEDFVKTRDNMLKRHEEELQENSYWLTVLNEYYFRGKDVHTHFVTLLQQTAPADIQAFARSLLEQDNFIEIIMEP